MIFLLETIDSDVFHDSFEKWITPGKKKRMMKVGEADYS